MEKKEIYICIDITHISDNDIADYSTDIKYFTEREQLYNFLSQFLGEKALTEISFTSPIETSQGIGCLGLLSNNWFQVFQPIKQSKLNTPMTDDWLADCIISFGINHKMILKKIEINI